MNIIDLFFFSTYLKVKYIIYIQIIIYLSYLLFFNHHLYLHRNIGINYLDKLFIILIDSIGFIMIIYSINNMKDEESKNYLIYIIDLSIFVMKLLIYFNHFYSLYISWELWVGISFLLVRYYRYTIINNKAAIKTIMVNRIGDILFIYFLIKNYNYTFLSLHSMNTSLKDILVLFLFIKSAIFIRLSWLTSAMMAPVSRLLYPTTMVSSGLYHLRDTI